MEPRVEKVRGSQGRALLLRTLKNLLTILTLGAIRGPITEKGNSFMVDRSGRPDWEKTKGQLQKESHATNCSNKDIKKSACPGERGGKVSLPKLTR